MRLLSLVWRKPTEINTCRLDGRKRNRRREDRQMSFCCEIVHKKTRIWMKFIHPSVIINWRKFSAPEHLSFSVNLTMLYWVVVVVIRCIDRSNENQKLHLPLSSSSSASLRYFSTNLLGHSDLLVVVDDILLSAMVTVLKRNQWTHHRTNSTRSTGNQSIPRFNNWEWP